VDLFQIVDNAEQVSLHIHLTFRAQSKPIQSDGVAQVGKGRLSNRQPHAVKDAAGNRIDLVFHLLGESFSTFGIAAKKIGDCRVSVRSGYRKHLERS
jgi:hypothetical protein